MKERHGKEEKNKEPKIKEDNVLWSKYIVTMKGGNDTDDGIG